MSIEEREGVLDQVTEKGIILGGARLSYSKWFEGDRPTEDALGCKIRVVVDAGTKCTFLKKVVHVGEKTVGWKAPEPRGMGFPGSGGGRRYSPEEVELKREEGIRIARSVAIDRAITMAKEGIPIENVASLAQVIEEYILRGQLPSLTQASRKGVPGEDAPEKSPGPSPASVPHQANPEGPRTPGPSKEASSATPVKPKRLQARMVSALFNEALRGGQVADWRDFLALVRSVLKVEVKDPYQLSVPDFAKVESFIRTKLGRTSAA